VCALVDGNGSLTGPGKLKVNACGKDGDPVTWAVQLTGSDWILTVSGGKGPSGTASLLGSSLQIWSVTLTPPSAVTNSNLMLNKRDTRAKLTLFAQALGSSIGGMGNGNLKMVLRRPWQAAP
jgi:hypothetical protein